MNSTTITNNATQNNDGIVITTSYGPVEVTRVYASMNQKAGMLTAELKQTVTETRAYPAQRTVNSLSDPIFSVEDFKIESKTYDSPNTRVTWPNVPATMPDGQPMTKEFVQSKLPATARNVRILANKPILTAEQEAVIANPALGLTKEKIANSQVIRYGSNHPQAGQLILDNHGKPQYKINVYKATEVEDEDMRTTDPSDFYATPEIMAELTKDDDIQRVPGQTLDFN